MYKNILLVLFFLFVSILLVELVLILYGPYKDLVKNSLKPSMSVYERPNNFIQKQPHPDLDLIVENYFDQEGVKNYNQILTSKKKNIIAFFGDSYTENISIVKEFEFSNILNSKIKNFHIVNYGVGGYNLEQSFIRYLKYKSHDIKYVIFFMMPGDHFERNLIEFVENDKIKITEPDFNLFFKILGKLNISYLFIDAYFNYKYIFQNYHKTGKENYPTLYANKVYSEFYIKHERKEDDFDKILKYFNKTSIENGAKFILLLYPSETMINYVKDRLKPELNNIDYYVLDKNLIEKNFIFKNDSHWNELGNIYFAKNLIEILKNYQVQFDYLDVNFFSKNIENFYSKNQ